jgi:hypothetical protein
MSHVSVFSFRWFEGDSSEETISPRMATLDAITRMNGSAIEGTRMEVDSARIDRTGCFVGDPGCLARHRTAQAIREQAQRDR